jgi:acyl-CoA thioesterase FadM
MNAIFRMLYVLIRSLFCARIGPGQLVSELGFRVLPTDVDFNFHMNNGRYLTICDLDRVDIYARSGLLKAMFKRNWLPVIAEHTMIYKKPLGLFERFKVTTKVTHWDEKYFYMNHTFNRGERIMAEGTSKACVYARGVGVVRPDDALAAVEQDRSK